MERCGKILLQLCLSLFLLHLIFLISSLTWPHHRDNQRTSPWCVASGVMLHYSLLSSLAWMLVEAVEMYQALVTVFTKRAPCSMTRTCLLAWGIPMVIVAVTVAVDRANYHSKGGLCFVSNVRPAVYYGCVVAPACGVLAVNCVLFVMLTRVLLTPRFQQHRPSTPLLTPTQVRGAFTVMVLLGVTWIFGPMAIQEAKLAFSYLFCLLNSLQGFLIFIFRCLLNPEARQSWLQLLHTGTLKKKRGLLLSRLNSDTSSRAEAARSGGTVPRGGTCREGGKKNASRHSHSNGLSHHCPEKTSLKNDVGDRKNSRLSSSNGMQNGGEINSQLCSSNSLQNERETDSRLLSKPNGMPSERETNNQLSSSSGMPSEREINSQLSSSSNATQNGGEINNQLCNSNCLQNGGEINRNLSPSSNDLQSKGERSSRLSSSGDLQNEVQENSKLSVLPKYGEGIDTVQCETFVVEGYVNGTLPTNCRTNMAQSKPSPKPRVKKNTVTTDMGTFDDHANFERTESVDGSAANQREGNSQVVDHFVTCRSCESISDSFEMLKNETDELTCF